MESVANIYLLLTSVSLADAMSATNLGCFYEIDRLKGKGCKTPVTSAELMWFSRQQTQNWQSDWCVRQSSKHIISYNFIRFSQEPRK